MVAQHVTREVGPIGVNGADVGHSVPSTADADGPVPQEASQGSTSTRSR